MLRLYTVFSANMCCMQLIWFDYPRENLFAIITTTSTYTVDLQRLQNLCKKKKTLELASDLYGTLNCVNGEVVTITIAKTSLQQKKILYCLLQVYSTYSLVPRPPGNE